MSLALASGTAKATEYEIMKLVPPDPSVSFSYSHSINNGGVVVHMAKNHTRKEFLRPRPRRKQLGGKESVRCYLIYSGRARDKAIRVMWGEVQEWLAVVVSRFLVSFVRSICLLPLLRFFPVPLRVLLLPFWGLCLLLCRLLPLKSCSSRPRRCCSTC